MNEQERVLEAIAELSGKIEGRMSEFDERLEKVEKANHITVKLAQELKKHQARQQSSIDELFQRVEALCKGESVMWRSQDEREIGLDKQAVYDIIRECGYGRREGLQILDTAGRIAKDRKQYAKPERIGDKVCRMIVIIDKEW
ncbi:MAG: hypothetical protein IJ428_01200 [Clostridia bacterium]|nr:hypothetical protein [Clostridia bacterium]